MKKETTMAVKLKDTQGELMAFDRRRLARLKKAYQAAQSIGANDFVFDKQTLVTDYAKYMIDYLDTWLHPGAKKKP